LSDPAAPHSIEPVMNTVIATYQSRLRP